MKQLFVFLSVLVASLGMAAAQDAQEEADRSVTEILAEHPELSMFYEMLQNAGLLVNFQEGEDDEGITVFAPSNAAFEQLSQEQLDALRSDLESGVLESHVAQDAFTSDELEAHPNSEEFTLEVTSDDAGNLIISDVRVVEADLIASNGVVHIIDGVLGLELLTPGGRSQQTGGAGGSR